MRVEKVISTLQNAEQLMRGVLRTALFDSRQDFEEAVLMQLSQGKRSDDVFLPDYSNVSVTVYGKPPGPMRLFDQGDFYEGIEARITGDGLELVGTDVKSEMLKLRYGDEIIGLSEENKNRILYEVIYPRMLVNLKSLWQSV